MALGDPRSFSHRVVYRGRLELLTGLHIGGGRLSLAPTDDPVVRTPEGYPYIPGSSLKGAFRATVEKLADAAGVWTCFLQDQRGCVGAPGDEQKAVHQQRRQAIGWTEANLLQAVSGRLCATCQLFGSPFFASKIFFDDLYPVEPATALVEVRDGVAIDRDSERAVDSLKYDFEVAPAGQSFGFSLVLDEPEPTDLGLTAIGLLEYVSGFGQIGGKRSRGLGACRLVDLEIYELNLHDPALDSTTRAARLRRYLLGTTLTEKLDREPDPEAYLLREIDDLLRRAAGVAEGG